MDKLGAESSKLGSKKRNPKCSRCRNHELEIEVKYHKRFCPHKKCRCDMCIKTNERQEKMKRQTADRRAREQYKMLMEMRKIRSIDDEKGNDKTKNEEDPSPPSINGSNSSNSSDMPSLSNHNSNTETCWKDMRDLYIDKYVMQMPQIAKIPLVPHATSPSTTVFKPESAQKRTDLQQLPPHTRFEMTKGRPSSDAMGNRVSESRADVEVAMRRITQAKNLWHPEAYTRIILMLSIFILV